MEILNKICGTSQKTKWLEINLEKESILANEAARKMGVKTSENLFLVPRLCADWIKNIVDTKQANFSYGGLYEDRKNLWHGSYLKEEESVHLGIDINIDANNPVYCPAPAVVEDVLLDEDQNGGWGERLVLKTSKGYVLFAHMILCPSIPYVGQQIKMGEQIGIVAPNWINGGWFPHLHLQGLKSLDLLKNLDGYGPARLDNAENYPNPLTLF